MAAGAAALLLFLQKTKSLMQLPWVQRLLKLELLLMSLVQVWIQ